MKDFHTEKEALEYAQSIGGVVIYRVIKSHLR